MAFGGGGAAPVDGVDGAGVVAAEAEGAGRSPLGYGAAVFNRRGRGRGGQGDVHHGAAAGAEAAAGAAGGIDGEPRGVHLHGTEPGIGHVGLEPCPGAAHHVAATIVATDGVGDGGDARGHGGEFGGGDVGGVGVEAFHGDVGVGHLHGECAQGAPLAATDGLSPAVVGTPDVIAAGADHEVARVLAMEEFDLADEAQHHIGERPGVDGEHPHYRFAGGGSEHLPVGVEEPVGRQRVEPRGIGGFRGVGARIIRRRGGCCGVGGEELLPQPARHHGAVARSAEVDYHKGSVLEHFFDFCCPFKYVGECGDVFIVDHVSSHCVIIVLPFLHYAVGWYKSNAFANIRGIVNIAD